jgi:hypothetical protein
MVALMVIGCVALAQSQDTNQPSVVAQQMSAMALALRPLESIAVPYDQAEPVTGGFEPADTAEARADALRLITTARRLSEVRRYPYTLKTSFSAYGQSGGTWSMENTSPSGNVYLWTAQGPSFSGTFLYKDQLLSSNQAGGEIPLSLAEVRNALWSVYYPAIGPYAALRVSTGNMAGAEVRCVLVARGIHGKQPAFPEGRSYGESEYCVDPKTGGWKATRPHPGSFFDTIIPPPCTFTTPSSSRTRSRFLRAANR